MIGFLKQFISSLKITPDSARKIIRKIIFAGLAVFFLLGIVVHFFPILSPDIAISRELQEHSQNTVQSFMAAVSFFGTPLVALFSVFLASSIFFLLSRKREAFFMLGVFAADGANALVKIIINRPRPNAGLVEVLQRSTDPSFPSGHVVHYVVFFGLLCVLILSLGKFQRSAQAAITAVFSAPVLLISVSRVYLGAHWATDVVGGYLLGFAMLWFLLHLYFANPEPPKS